MDADTKANRGSQALRAFLKDTGTTQSQFHLRTGISQAQLSRLVRGERLANREQGMALREHAKIELEWWDEEPLPETTAPPSTSSEAPTGTAG